MRGEMEVRTDYRLEEGTCFSVALVVGSARLIQSEFAHADLTSFFARNYRQLAARDAAAAGAPARAPRVCTRPWPDQPLGKRPPAPPYTKRTGRAPPAPSLCPAWGDLDGP